MKLKINDQEIEVLNTRVDELLWYFNTLPTPSMIEFISPNLNKVVVAFNTSNLAIPIESQPLNLDLDVQDQCF